MNFYISYFNAIAYIYEQTNHDSNKSGFVGGRNCGCFGLSYCSSESGRHDWPILPSDQKFRNSQVRRALYHLTSQKLIGVRKERDKDILVLTEKGKEKVLKFKLNDLVLPVKTKWDNKFRLVIFDIPEKFKYKRDIFSKKFKSLGMLPIQKSVWLWPYNCTEEVEYLRTMYEIRPFVTCAVVEQLELNGKIRKQLQDQFKIL